METFNDKGFGEVAAASKFMTIYNHANDLLKNGHYDEAIRFYDAACAAWSKQQFGSCTLAYNAMGAECWNNRGAALLKMDRQQEAIESFNQALQLVPGHCNATHNLQLAKQSMDNLSRVKHVPRKWWQFWKSGKMVSPNKKTYICKSCLQQFNPSELRNDNFWQQCPRCKGPIVLNS
jgi:tetratricopeptide (TPR) repeat protein